VVIVTARLLAAVLVVAGMAACGDDGRPGEVSVADAFATGSGGSVAIYMDVANPGGDDRIVGATVEGRGGEVTLHQVVLDDGLSRMERTDDLDVPEGGTRFAPGGSHLMGVGLDPHVEVGEPITVAIDLASSDDVRIEVDVVGFDEAIEREQEWPDR
jgi:copper(I)-binding protein